MSKIRSITSARGFDDISRRLHEPEPEPPDDPRFASDPEDSRYWLPMEPMNASPLERQLYSEGDIIGCYKHWFERSREALIWHYDRCQLKAQAKGDPERGKNPRQEETLTPLGAIRRKEAAVKDAKKKKSKGDQLLTFEDCTVAATTSKAVLIEPPDTVDLEEPVWIPASQLAKGSTLGTDSEKGDSGTIIVPAWLAWAKGLASEK